MYILFTSNADLKLDQHDQLNGHEFQRAPGDGEGQESLACMGHKKKKKKKKTHVSQNLDTTEQLK